jgi:arylsulfatase A-like enzyme
MADDLGSAELSCTGSEVIKTPHIDALRKDGLLFTRAYAGAPVCAPSRCVLLTGRDLLHAQIRDNAELPNPSKEIYGGQPGLATGTATIARLLKNAGYRTGCFGKWGLGGAHADARSGHPLEQGFDRFFGYLCQRNAHSYWPTYLEDDRARLDLPGNDRTHGDQWAPDLITAKALAWLALDKKRPYFLYFPSIIPHLALQAPADLVQAIPVIKGDAPYTGNAYRSCERPRATYIAMVQRLDHHVGQLVQAVRERGELANTLFIITSDNGATWKLGGYDAPWFRGNAALRGHKGDVFEGGLRVPLIASWSGVTPRGASSDMPIGHVDWLRTISALAGCDEKFSSEGADMSGLLRGEKSSAANPRPLAFEFPQGDGAQAVVLGHWKGVRIGSRKNASAPLQLFDLQADPGEKHDIAASHPDIVAAMSRVLAERTPASRPGWEFPKEQR